MRDPFGLNLGQFRPKIFGAKKIEIKLFQKFSICAAIAAAAELSSRRPEPRCPGAPAAAVTAAKIENFCEKVSVVPL